MKYIKDYQVIVIGAGAAGLTAALHLAPLKTLVLNKVSSETGGSSPYAQGGIAAAIAEGDSPELHFQDTLIAGDGLCNREIVYILTRNTGAAIDFLQKEKMPFDRNKDRSLVFNREGSHSRARILRSKGDSTGAALMDTLKASADRAKHITYLEGCMGWKLHVSEGKASGIVAWKETEGWIFFETDQIILAAGGAGQVYSTTTNPAESTGDAIALAGKAGVKLNMMEMVQFHPTALDVGKVKGRIPLITEALRGAGAHLIDEDGRRIMEGIHHLKELAPRDVVARAIWGTLRRGSKVFLDARRIPDVENHFPTVTASCRENGIDITNNPIPVTPAAHYLMGGVLADSHGRTSIKGLWCIGESAGTGLHGANRLASNSLPECLVSGIRSAEDVSKNAGDKNHVRYEIPEPLVPRITGKEADLMKNELQKTMFSGFGLMRTRDGMSASVARLAVLYNRIEGAEKVQASSFSSPKVRKILELQNLLFTAGSISGAALNNPISQGAHYLEKENQKRITA